MTWDVGSLRHGLSRRPRGQGPHPGQHRPRRAARPDSGWPGRRVLRLRPEQRLAADWQPDWPARPAEVRRRRAPGGRAGRRRDRGWSATRGGRSKERNCSTPRPWPATPSGSPTSSSGSPCPPMVNNLGWTGSLTLLDFLRDVGKHASVNQMIARESVRGPPGERAGHLVHRVQLPAAAGPTTTSTCAGTTGSRSRSAARTSGATCSRAWT